MSDITENMKEVMGFKAIKAYPMTKKEYNDYRGWALPEGEDPNEIVYLVEYAVDPESTPNHPDHAGYISMSPKHVFDEAYKESGNFSFGMAVVAAKAGKRVARTGWNGKGMFAYIEPQYDTAVGEIREWENELEIDALTKLFKGAEEAQPVIYRATWKLRTADGSIATWAPSGSDSLADDWMIID